MKILINSTFLSLALVSFWSCKNSNQQELLSDKNKTPKAVFIILDGIPADVLENTPTPNLDNIASEGGYTRALMGGNPENHTKTPTISAVGYNSLLTGTWAYKHNVWGNGIKKPNYNFWNIFRISKNHDPKENIAIYSTWEDNRTKLIGEGIVEAGNLKMNYSFDGFENDTVRFPHLPDRKFIFDIDEMVSKKAAKHIKTTAPDLSWVYLEFTDDMGHKFGDSPQMTEAVKSADNQVGRIWESIQHREKEFNEDWMIIITTDHGRDEKTGKHHGGHSERQMTIWMVTNSSDVNSRFKNDIPEMVDIMPGIANHMGYKIPDNLVYELDGAPIIGDISLADVEVEQLSDSLTISWTTYDENSVEILGSKTNNYLKSGKEDEFTKIITAKPGENNITVPKGDYVKMALKGKHNSIGIYVEGE